MAYLDQELWGRIGVHNGTGHLQTDPVQLLNLSPPDQCKPPARAVHLGPSSPVTLQAEGETSLISELLEGRFSHSLCERACQVSQLFPALHNTSLGFCVQLQIYQCLETPKHDGLEEYGETSLKLFSHCSLQLYPSPLASCLALLSHLVPGQKAVSSRHFTL